MVVGLTTMFCRERRVQHLVGRQLAVHGLRAAYCSSPHVVLLFICGFLLRITRGSCISPDVCGASISPYLLRVQADAIMIEELNKADIYREIGQAFAVLLPVKSVGVMGDCRYKI